MPLRAYLAKRDFHRIPEPRGRELRPDGRFVVQKHAARQLHYDFRLALDGVLKSWAVAKGPSLDPHDRRLAVRVEDHPADYADFEGTIPKGQYGGGTVIVWDRGKWRPIGDAHEGLQRGHLKFELRGSRLKGRWSLVRMRPRGKERAAKEHWLLIKGDDAAARYGVSARPAKNDASVVSGRTLNQIAAVSADEARSEAAAAARRKDAGKQTGRRAERHARSDADPLRQFRLTHPDRVLYRAQGLTKRDIAAYYLDLADHILPHIAGRPLSLVRCPQGSTAQCFYQKHPPTGMLKNVRRVRIRGREGGEEYLVVDDVAGLIELVQFGGLELHPWGCRADDLEHPDYIVFDFDPGPSVPWGRVIAAALEMRGLLDEIGLESFPKTTGGKGLHVVLPIERTAGWEEAKRFARDLADVMERRAPDRYTTNVAKKARAGRIFIDYLRNTRGATAIAPYSTRARDGAPVAAPLSWREVSPRLSPASFTVETVRQRLSKRGDPWRGFFKLRQRLRDVSDVAEARMVRARKAS